MERAEEGGHEDGALGGKVLLAKSGLRPLLVDGEVLVGDERGELAHGHVVVLEVALQVLVLLDDAHLLLALGLGGVGLARGDRGCAASRRHDAVGPVGRLGRLRLGAEELGVSDLGVSNLNEQDLLEVLARVGKRVLVQSIRNLKG